MTTTAHSDSDVEFLEALESEEQDGLKDLDPKRLGFDEFDGGSVDAEDTLALLDCCVGD